MMRVALPLVLMAGAAIGLALPRRHEIAQAPAATPTQIPVPMPRPSPAPSMAVAAIAGETLIPRDASGHFVANTLVNGAMLPMIVDTGADTVALTLDDARAAHIAVDPNTFTVIGHGAGGEVRGTIVMLDTVAVDGRTVTGVRGAVIEGLDRSLLGQSYLSRTGGVTLKNDEMRLS